MTIVTKGRAEENFNEHNYEAYAIYLHEKGHFWPNSNMMKKLGQTSAIVVKPHSEQAK